MCFARYFISTPSQGEDKNKDMGMYKNKYKDKIYLFIYWRLIQSTVQGHTSGFFSPPDQILHKWNTLQNIHIIYKRKT